MATDDDEKGSDLAAAAEIHAARREVDSAIADLASSPLDQAAADRMREVLASTKLSRARRALCRLQQPTRSRPRLSIVGLAETDATSTSTAGPAVGPAVGPASAGGLA